MRMLMYEELLNALREILLNDPFVPTLDPTRLIRAYLAIVPDDIKVRECYPYETK